jgi:hypothetical protein
MHSSDKTLVVRRRWINAAIVLAGNPLAQVRCPVCDAANLEVIEVAWPDKSHKDAYMSCPNCGARNVLTKPQC